MKFAYLESGLGWLGPGGGGGELPAGAPMYCPGTGTRCPFAYMHWMYAKS